jgi:glycerol-3-phosphate acyltransferase PlsY
MVPDSISDSAYLLIVVLAPSWGPAALVFKWLWRRLVHQALSLKSTLAIYFVCVVSTPSLIYFSLAEPVITYEEAIALYFLIFLLAAFIVFRMHRGPSTRTRRELAAE